MGMSVSNVKVVQCTIFRWNQRTTNWIRCIRSRGLL